MLLRKLANNGQSILITIHQPSSKLFQIFDQLLLLDKSGRTLYFGEIGHDASKLIKYFERNGAVECEVGQNPAEWVLNVTSDCDGLDRSSKHQSTDWCGVWTESSERQQVLQRLMALNKTTSELSIPQIHALRSQYATSYLKQSGLVTKRIFQEYWRSPVYLYSKMGLCVSVVRKIRQPGQARS